MSSNLLVSTKHPIELHHEPATASFHAVIVASRQFELLVEEVNL